MLDATQALTQPQPTSTATITPATVVPPTESLPPGEQRWRAQQLQREIFEPPKSFVALNPVPLLWFDPLTGQEVEIGLLLGEFPAQARFVLRRTQQPALEIRYRINADFGLTAISSALEQRMHAAGYTDTVPAYVILTEHVRAKE